MRCDGTGHIVNASIRIAVAVVVVATAAVRRGLNQITETCPADADVVGTISDIHVAVDAVLDVAVVDPYVCGSESSPPPRCANGGRLCGQCLWHLSGQTY